MGHQLLNSVPTEQLNPQQILNLLLDNRRIPPETREQFLNPRLESENIQKLLDSQELEQAQNLLGEAIGQKRPIIIHGDYDVDGICATAILWETIYKHLKYPLVKPFIPHRLDHGYGISDTGLEEIRKICRNLSPNKKPLLITVDCGITAGDKIKRFRQEGGEVVITDHHQPPTDLPQADALLHTTEVSGTAVAWILSSALLKETTDPEIFLDLTALATIADMVPLTGHNRSLVVEGLQKLSSTSRPGLQELNRRAGIDHQTLSPYHVGWIIAPRLNAAGRLGHALNSLRLLVVEDRKNASKLAQYLENMNQERQTLTRQAKKQAEELTEADKQAVFVLSHPQWHEGIIGLVASEIVKKYHRPALAISQKEPLSKGSARSTSGFNLVSFLQKLEHLLENYGGHAQAAGFSLKPSNIESFRRQAQEIAQQEIKSQPEPSICVDLKLNLSQINRPLLKELKKLEPHGIGNPRPVFYSSQIPAFRIHTVGKNNQHLKLNLREGDSESELRAKNLSAIGFNLGHLSQEIAEGDLVNIIYQIQENDYHHPPEIQLKIKNIELAK